MREAAGGAGGFWLTGTLIASALLACVLAVKADFDGVIPFWHWPRHPILQLIPQWELLLLIPAAALCLYVSRTRPGVAIVLGATALRLAVDVLIFARIDLRQRLLYHVETIRFTPGGILQRYEEESAAAFAPMFVETKPPGLMLVHEALAFVAQMLSANFADAFWLMMIGSYIIYLACAAGLMALLIRLGSAMHDKGSVLLAVGLYALSPHHLLLQMEFPTRVFPLFLLVLWLLGRREWTGQRAVAIGLLWGCGLFVDWSVLLMGVIPFVQLLLLRSVKRLCILGGFFLLGAALHWGPLLLLTDNNYPRLFRLAMERHRWIYGIDNLSMAYRWWLVVYQLFEFLLVIGLPLAVLALWSGCTRRSVELGFLPLAVYTLVVMFNGSVVSEAARLWSVLIPGVLLLTMAAKWSRSVIITAIVAQAIATGVYLWMRWFVWT